MNHDYPWGEAFQMRLLAYFLREPEKLYDTVEPQYFSASPLFVEICRVAKAALKETRHAKLDRHTLVELLRPSIGEEESWSLYKRTVKELYKTPLTDKSILYKQAFDFAKEMK